MLALIQDHGYPDGKKCEEGNPEFYIWVVDGEVRCQTQSEFASDLRWSLLSPAFKGRCNEGYSLVSSTSEGHFSVKLSFHTVSLGPATPRWMAFNALDLAVLVITVGFLVGSECNVRVDG